MKKFLVTLLVAMLALSCVAFAEQDNLSTLAAHPADGSLCADRVDFKAPTCQATGYCVHKVAGADGKYVYETYTLKMEAHGKDKGVITTDPTCTDKGVITYTCQNVIDNKGTICGTVWTDKVPQTTHTLEEAWLVEPTCTTPGVLADKACPDCGYVPSYANIYTWWATGSAGKYDANGYAWSVECAPQNKNHDPKYHTDLSGWLTISEQSCVDPLLRENLCRACGLTLREYKPATGHDWEDVEVKTMIVNSPDCETPVVYADYEKCNDCDYYRIVGPSTYPKTSKCNLDDLNSAHPVQKFAVEELTYWGEKLLTSTANSKHTGSGSYYMASAKHLYVLLDAEVNDKDFVKGHHVIDEETAWVSFNNTKDIKCWHENNDNPKKTDKTDKNGYYGQFYKTTSYLCDICGEHAKEFDKVEIASAPAHNFTAWKEVVAPTEDTNFIGKWTRYCLNKGCEEFESYIGGVCGKDNHLADEAVLENVVEATYTAEGSADEVVYCAICGEELSRTEIVLPMLEGINPEDNTLYEDGKASTATGIVTVDGKDTYLINGVKQVNALGAILVDGEWYWMAHGVVQTQAKGAQLYDGEWFYVENGEIDITKNGLIAHDGEKFWVACGRLTTEYTGLVQNGSEWILISAGRFAAEYTGVVTYDGAQFNVENGIVK